jgi:hypothetical protein
MGAWSAEGSGNRNNLLSAVAPGLMQDGAKSHFHCFQVDTAGLFPFGQDAAQQRGYFARDLGLDRFGRFFPVLWAYPLPAGRGRCSH